MSRSDRTPEDLESLLDGDVPPSMEGSNLPAYLLALREDAVGSEPQPSAALAELLEHGVVPVASSSASTRGIRTWRRRARVAGRVLVTKFAALGLLGKAVAAGAAVTVAASSAGVAGVLPPPAQRTFDAVVEREADPVPAPTPSSSPTPTRSPSLTESPPSEAPALTPRGRGERDDRRPTEAGMRRTPPSVPPAGRADDEAPGQQGSNRDDAGAERGAVEGGEVADEASNGRRQDGPPESADEPRSGAPVRDGDTRQQPPTPGAEAPAPAHAPTSAPTEQGTAAGDPADGSAEGSPRGMPSDG